MQNSRAHFREPRAGGSAPPTESFDVETPSEHATEVFVRRTFHKSPDASVDARTNSGAHEPRLTSSSRTLVPKQTLGNAPSARIAIKTKRRILFLDAADLVAVEARGNYVLLVQTSNSHMLRESISTFEDKLHLQGFVRIHRSVLVNSAFVEEMHAGSTGEYVLQLRGGRQFTVTRTYKKNLQMLAQLWIGMESSPPIEPSPPRLPVRSRAEEQS